MIEHGYARDREKIGAGLHFCKRNGEQVNFYRDKSGRRYAIGRWRPYVRGEEALAAKLLVAALSLAVGRQRQPPPLARLLELKTHDRVPVDMSASIDHVGKYFSSRAHYPDDAHSASCGDGAEELVAVFVSTAATDGDCTSSR